MKNFLAFIGVAVLIASCGGSSGVGSLDKLPRMTNPVITSGASALKFTGTSVKANAAATGLTLWGADSTSFAHGDSRSMCEMTNLTIESLDKAAQADKVLCYIQNTIVAPANAGAFTGDPYDGNYHTVTLHFTTKPNPNSNNDAPIMKFKVVKSGGKISEFEMFMCMGGTADAPSQSEYLHEVINSDGKVAITSKDIEGQWNSDLAVSGTINSDGQFTQKTITAVNGGTSDNCTNAQKAVFDQYSDSMQVLAYQTGHCDCTNCGDFSNQAFTVFQLINGTSTDLHTLAIGDGSLKALFGGNGSGSASDSWNGDTKKNLSDWTTGAYYTTVNAGAYPTTNPTAEVAAIAFATSESWNCSGTSEGTMTVDMPSLDPICSVLGLRHDGAGGWINCWDIIENH